MDKVNVLDKGPMYDAIILAWAKGYRVTNDGKLIGLKNKELMVRVRGNQKYPTFSVAGVPSVKNKYGVFGIPVHKFAAFCFYGDKMFLAQCVRHKDGDVLNISKSNIILGTHVENARDKPKSVRSASAKAARAAQGSRPSNAKFSDDEVRYIRNSKESGPLLASRFNVTRQAIYLIKKGVNYADV